MIRLLLIAALLAVGCEISVDEAPTTMVAPCCIDRPPPTWHEPAWVSDPTLPMTILPPQALPFFPGESIRVEPASQEEGTARLARLHKDGSQAWAIELPGPAARAYLLSEPPYGEVLWVVSWLPTASGGRLQRIDPESGEILWTKEIEPIAGATAAGYRTQMDIDRFGAAFVAVRGWETGGGYMDLFDADGTRRGRAIPDGPTGQGE